MDNKGVLIGSIIFVFGSFILMIGMMLWESNKAYKMKELARTVQTESRPAASNGSRTGLFDVQDARWGMKAAKWFKSLKGPSRWAAKTAIPMRRRSIRCF